MVPMCIEGRLTAALGEEEQEETLEDGNWSQAGQSLSQKRLGAEGSGSHVLGQKSYSQAIKAGPPKMSGL